VLEQLQGQLTKRPVDVPGGVDEKSGADVNLSVVEEPLDTKYPVGSATFEMRISQCVEWLLELRM